MANEIQVVMFHIGVLQRQNSYVKTVFLAIFLAAVAVLGTVGEE
jgi:hypothetical protein